MGCVLGIVDALFPIGAHLSLDREEGALAVGDGLTLCGHTDQALAILGEGDHARRGSRALGICNHDGLTALDGRHTTVGRA